MSDDRVEHLEFRPDEKGEFDEIVVRFADGSVHVETLSDQGCYVGFSWDDGRLCQWWIGCTGRGKLTYNHEVTEGDPPRFPSGYGLSTGDTVLGWREAQSERPCPTEG